MQMGSPGLPSPMPEFSSINSSTYYRELHPRERETRPEGPELAKKRPLRYFLGTLLIFIGRAIKARETRAREFASRFAICSFFFFAQRWNLIIRAYYFSRWWVGAASCSKYWYSPHLYIERFFISKMTKINFHYVMSFILDKYLKYLKKCYFNYNE